MTKLPVVGVTLGDACGIGPEIVLKAFSRPEIYDRCIPIVIGSASILENARRFVESAPKIWVLSHPSEAVATPGVLPLLDLANLNAEDVVIGHLSSAAGQAAYEYISTGVRLSLDGTISGIVTAPINKAALHLAGHHFAGHTELLAYLTDTPEVVMMLVGRQMRVAFVTTHLALSEVSQQITQPKITNVLGIVGESLKRLGIIEPRIAVCALNPHAGEEGAFGNEESHIISPAIQQAVDWGWHVEGPYPADTLFVKAKDRLWDAIVAMYHDQGNVPIKLLEFGQIVNVTLGLPMVRTSVDHGTAFDIAGKGIASETSLLAAVDYAAKLASPLTDFQGASDSTADCTS